MEQTNNLLLFEELLDFLKAPLLNDTCLPAEYSSDVGGIAVCEEEEQTKRELEEARAATIQIPYEPWGECCVTDGKGLHWSREGLLFVQMRLFWRSMEELALANKTPEAPSNSVRCLTVHSSKGLEFQHVYLVGMSEDQLPSFQSKKSGDDSREMQEERRNCFVAITRTLETLTMSYGEKYNGWRKAPSRFLFEMGLLGAKQ